MRKILILLAATLTLTDASLLCAQGEIGPHFPETKFTYIGDVYGNSAYIMADDSGHFGSTSPDGSIYADVWTAREDFLILFKDPKKGTFCIVDASDPNFSRAKLEFRDFPKDSSTESAWSRAENPKAFGKDLKSGKEFRWIYVISNSTKDQTDLFYVSPEIKSDPKSGYPFTTVMIVSEQRSSVSVFPAKKKFSSISTDYFGVPLGEEKYHDMKPGDLSEAVLNFITPKKESQVFIDSVFAAVTASGISFDLPRLQQQQGAVAAQKKGYEVVGLMEKSLADAKKVSDAFLDKLDPELKKFYRSYLMQGQLSYLEGLRSGDGAKQVSAARTMMAWGEFWDKNKKRILAKLD